MARKLTLGIDVGTTTVKAGVIDDQGRMIGHFSRGYATHRYASHRHGRTFVEQNPDDWMRLVRDAMAGFSHHAISTIGLTSQVNTHVFVGADGTPLMPAIQWQDGRAVAEAATLDAAITSDQKVAWWGAPMPIDASHVLSRMAWVAHHQPDIWEKTRWVMLPKDYCLFKLTGEITTDPLSNFGLVDRSLNYIPAALDLVPGAADRTLSLAPVCEIVGKVRGGPLTGTPIVSGTMDAWAGLVGTGGARDRSSVYISGTSEILGISSQQVIPTPGAIVFPQSNGIRVHAAPTQSGGDAVAWFAQTSGLSFDGISAAVSATPRSAATPLFLPQLEGERAPLWDADLRAAFLGVSRQTTQGDFARAVFEGVALAARMALETLQSSANLVSDSIACSGGGFRSDPWAQIRADVLGVELRILAASEPGVFGAATLAAIGAGDFAGFEDAHTALARYDRIFEPEPAAHGQYNTLFEIYKQAIVTHADIGKRLSALLSPPP